MGQMEFIAGPYSPDDTAAITRLDAEAFNFPPDRAIDYHQLAGPANFRAVRVDGQWAACLASIPCGQFFGGRAIPMAGIAAVAVAAEQRGRGIAKFMMRAELERLFAARVPISSLYPATIPLYRSAGYELAGVQFEQKAAISAMNVRDRSLRVRREQPDDAPRLAELYSAFAVETNGNVDRVEFFWKRVRNFRGNPTQGFVFEGTRGIEGYVFFFKRPFDQPPSGPGHYTIQLTDFVAATPAAARGIMTFLADHYSLSDVVVWPGGVGDAMLQLGLREVFLRPTMREYWMLRIVHCAAALEARGYVPFISGEVHLDIRDDVLPGNNGPLLLKLHGGRGEARPGGRGDVHIDVRGLAALYSGFFTPAELRHAGYLDGPQESVALLTASLAGPSPWMRDPF